MKKINLILLYYGYGLSITGMTVGKSGIFGSMGQCTIQGVSFKDLKFSQESRDNVTSMFAYYVCSFGSSS